MGKRWLLWLTLVAATALPDTASACRDPQNQRPFFHEAPPAAGEGIVVVDAEIVAASDDWGEARIFSIIQGNYSAEKLRFQTSVISSCAQIPGVGARGMIVGRVISTTGNLLIIDPIWGRSIRERKMANEFDEVDDSVHRLVKEAWEKSLIQK